MGTKKVNFIHENPLWFELITVRFIKGFKELILSYTNSKFSTHKLKQRLTLTFHDEFFYQCRRIQNPRKTWKYFKWMENVCLYVDKIYLQRFIHLQLFVIENPCVVLINYFILINWLRVIFAIAKGVIWDYENINPHRYGTSVK